jgi:hypothetical protein
MAIEGRRFRAEGEMAKLERADDNCVGPENKINENMEQTLSVFL